MASFVEFCQGNGWIPKKEHACRMHNWKSRNRRITNLKLQFSYWIAIPSASSSPSPLHSDATWPVPGRLAKRANSSNRKIGKDGIPPGKDRWLVASHYSHWSWFIMRPFGSGASAIYFHYGVKKSSVLKNTGPDHSTLTTLRDVTATPPQSVHFFSDLGMITSRRMEKCASKISSQIGLPC